MPAADDALLADERRAVDAFKKTALMVFGLAMQTYGEKLTDEQEVLMHLADIAIDVFSAESAVLRARAASDSERGRARRCTWTPHASSSTTRRCASTRRRARRSPRWSTATRCARCSRRCVVC